MISRNQLLAFLGAFFIAAMVIGCVVVLLTRASGTTIINVQPLPTDAPTPTACDLSAYNYLGIVIPPMEPNSQQTIPFPGGSVSLKCGPQGGKATGSVKFNPTAPTAMPTAPAVFCSWDGHVFQTGDTWIINGENSSCVSINGVGGWKPVNSSPATAVPTLAATSTPAQLAPTAAPAPFAFCALPSPDGKGNVGAYQPADTSPDGSAYVCRNNGQGTYIWVNR